MSEGKTLEERLAYLEEQNEGLKRVGGLAVVLVVILGVALFMVNQSIVKGVDTDALILSNDGRPAAALTVMKSEKVSSGHLGLVFYDYAGGVKANFSNIPQLDGMVMYDKAGNPRILIGVDERNIPTLALLGPDGRPVYSAIGPDQYKELVKTYGGGALPTGTAPGNPANPGQPAQTMQGVPSTPNGAGQSSAPAMPPATPAPKATP